MKNESGSTFPASETSPKKIKADAPDESWLARSSGAAKVMAVALTAALSAAEPRRIGVTAVTAPPWSHAQDLSETTGPAATAAKLRQRIAAIVADAQREDFREGSTSQFAKDLSTLVNDFGSAVFPEIQRMIASGLLRGEVGFEALTALAGLKHSAIIHDRLRLIEWALASPSAEMRYAAAFALATVRERAAAEPLRAAIIREPVRDIRKAFEKVLALLTP